MINPFGVVETNYPRLFAKHSHLLKSHGVNPLAALDPENPSFVDDAKALAVALIKTEQAREPYWPMAAQALVKGLLMVLRVKYRAKASLGGLRDILGLTPKALDLALENEHLRQSRAARRPERGLVAKRRSYCRTRDETARAGGARSGRGRLVHAARVDAPRHFAPA